MDRARVDRVCDGGRAISPIGRSMRVDRRRMDNPAARNAGAESFCSRDGLPTIHRAAIGRGSGNDRPHDRGTERPEASRAQRYQ